MTTPLFVIISNFNKNVIERKSYFNGSGVKYDFILILVI